MMSCPRVSGLTQHGIGNSWCGERQVGFYAPAAVGTPLSLHCQVYYGHAMRSLPATRSRATLLYWTQRLVLAQCGSADPSHGRVGGE